MEAWLSRDYYSNAGVTYNIRSWDRVKEVIPVHGPADTPELQ